MLLARWSAKANFMTEPTSRNHLSGGIFIALGLMGGAIVGMFNGQTSLGMVAGLGLGIVLAVLVWLWDVMARR